MNGSEEEQPVPPDETGIVEEGDRAESNVPVKADATEVIPMSASMEEGKRLELSEEPREKKIDGC